MSFKASRGGVSRLAKQRTAQKQPRSAAVHVLNALPVPGQLHHATAASNNSEVTRPRQSMGCQEHSLVHNLMHPGLSTHRCEQFM